MDWKADLESTCAGLGTSDGVNYLKDDDCIECVKDLIRFLRRDDGSHLLRRSLGQIGVVQSDLIPLLKNYSTDEELFDLLLRLLVNLTGPELLLFREELPQDKVTRNHFMELQGHRQKYKRAFVDPKLWAVLAQQLGQLLKKDYAERSEDDGLVIERILILVRNILQVPRDDLAEKRTDDEASTHDQVLWVLHKSGIEDLLLFVASSDEETQYCLHVLEIISLMFREQDPKHLASANFQRSKEEKQQDELELLRLREREMEKQKQKFLQTKSMRHSRFGGTFTLTNVKSISERSVIYHRPLTTLDNFDFDKEKRPKKVARNKQMPGDSEHSTRRSSLAIRLFLKEFCVEFLHGAYNNLMSVVKDNLLRHKAQNNDETYYLWAMKFFMHFNRDYKFNAQLIMETMSKSSFHFVNNQIEVYKDNFEHEKKNRPMCLIWSRRMHLAIRAYQELLLNLVAMLSSKDKTVQESGMILRSDVFYEPEYRELCLQQLSLYQPEKMSMSHLKDIVETTHVFLKLMEHLSKSSHIMVSQKKTKKASKKKSQKTLDVRKGENVSQTRESKENVWDAISTELSSLLQGNAAIPPVVESPFDAASEATMDQQKVMAMYRVQDTLLRKQVGQSVALLRASREIWPEDDAFGAQESEPEDEFMMMREILFADIPKPDNFKSGEDVAEADGNAEEAEDDDNILDKPEIEEDEEDEEEEVMVAQKVEQEFDFKGFVARFAVKSVCSAYAILLSNYDKNADHTNHCLIKMFHRVAFDMKLPALLFHYSILRTFQKIHKDYRLNPSHTTIRELNKFGKFLLQKFFQVASKNPHIWMESCFWKTSRDAYEVVEGYGTLASTKKEKASYWCEEDEEKLVRVFQQLKEMKDDQEERGGDMLDSITAFFEESGKSRRQVVRKLKEMALITNIKEVTNKPLKMRAPRVWAEEEIDQLRNLFEEYKDAMDPINRILDHLTVKRPKARVIDKIMELGLCDDKKKLKKKRTQRRLKEGDPGYLKSASESDSALDDSTEYDTYESGSDDEQEDLQESIRTKALDASQNPVCKPGIRWLKSCLDDELEDRDTIEDEDENEPVPIVPITEECILAMDCSAFLSILALIGLSPPNEQEQYWRIPTDFSSRKLSEKSKFLGQLEEDELDMSVLDLSLVVLSKPKKEKKMKKVKKKKTWMPMRRALTAEVADRIHNAVNVATSSTADNAKVNTKKKSKRIVAAQESSSESEKEKQNEDETDDDEKAIQNPKSRSFIESSDEDSDTKTTVAKIGKNRPLIKSDDSSSDEDKGNKGITTQPKRQRLPSSSSSSGVDDPWPVPRVPSDTEGDVTKTTVEASTTLNTTTRSRSISTSSSKSYRSRSSLSSFSSSSSRSPSRSPPRLLSSNSNTPKRTRSSPSPAKSEKKLKRAPPTDSSSEDNEESLPRFMKKKNTSILTSSDED